MLNQGALASASSSVVHMNDSMMPSKINPRKVVQGLDSLVVSTDDSFLDACMFYNDLAVYDGFGGPVLDPSEGDHLVAALGPTKKNIILQNHGILTAGSTVGEAVAYFIALERACETQMLVDAAAVGGRKKRIVSKEAAKYTKETTGNPEIMYMQFVPEYDWMLKHQGNEFLA